LLWILTKQVIEALLLHIMYISSISTDTCQIRMDSLPLIAMLAFASGLNATMPLFAIAVLVISHPEDNALQAHEFKSLVGTIPFTLLIGVLFVVELVADKVCFLDHGLHIVTAIAAPVAAALVAGALLPISCDDTQSLGIYLLAALVAFGSLALVVHVSRAIIRWHSTAASGGHGNPLVSVVEDVLAAFLVWYCFEHAAQIQYYGRFFTLAIALALCTCICSLAICQRVLHGPGKGLKQQSMRVGGGMYDRGGGSYKELPGQPPLLGYDVENTGITPLTGQALAGLHGNFAPTAPYRSDR
jgi:hypothetical protein